MKNDSNLLLAIITFFLFKIFIAFWYLLYAIPLFLIIPLERYFEIASLPFWQEFPILVVSLAIASYLWAMLLSKFNPFD